MPVIVVGLIFAALAMTFDLFFGYAVCFPSAKQLGRHGVVPTRVWTPC
jgi:hypothetical protein